MDGLYHQAYRYPPETILSRSFYEKNPEEFYRFYRDKMLYLDAEPNPAHKKLAQWEREGRLLAVITQNIDGLHQKAGSRNVLELHGSVHRNYCRRCGKLFDAQYLLRSSEVPRCDQCGGAVKPDVVLYEEALDQAVLQKAAGALRQADLLIVGGTSLTVYPAAGLLRYFQGSRLAVVNQTALPLDQEADLLIQGQIGQVFSQLSFCLYSHWTAFLPAGRSGAVFFGTASFQLLSGGVLAPLL